MHVGYLHDQRSWSRNAGGLAVLIAPARWAQDDKVITKQYDDGGVYEGTFKDGKQHGSGTYRLPNGYDYSGDWVEGEIRGQGRARVPERLGLRGRSSSPGKPEGNGKITFADGGTYEGDWLDGKINGQGTAVYANGVTLHRRLRERAAPRPGPDGKPERLCLRRRLGERHQGRRGHDHLSRRRGL